jgi:DNA helicase II / ATP-dependent DNA helicase PcrA
VQPVASASGVRLGDLLDGLNDAQRRAVTTDGAPLCIVAGAGSGKTRVLTRRIAHRSLSGEVDARHVLAVTFTRKAAGELRTRLARLGLRDDVTAGTFHALAYAELRRLSAERGRQPPELLDSKVKLLARILPKRRFIAVDVAGEIEWAKARLISPSRYAEAAAAAGRRPPVGYDELGEFYRRYEDEKARQKRVDFDDLLWECIKVFEHDAEQAAALRWRLRHLFVDEFQDVNPLQHRLLEAWRGDRLDLCVVGDPNQAIYGWNGADPGLLTGFTERFPGAEVLVLDLNYRSTPQILAAANAVLRGGPLPASGPVRLDRLQASRPDGRIPVEAPHRSDRHEARAVTRSVVDRHGPGTRWSHQAILFRTNAQAVLFEEALNEAGVPYRVKGRAPFIQLPEIRQAMRALASSRRPFREAVAGMEADLTESPVDEEDEAPAATMSDAEEARIGNLQELLRLADEYASAEGSPSAAGFGTWLTAMLRGEDSGGSDDAVELVTFHAAKGLEWPIVYVTGLEDGLVPIGHARTAAEMAEERRLFYVAVTRAQDELVLSWAEHRTFGTRTSPRSPSAYLDDIAPALAAMRAGERPADWRDNLDRERQRLRAGPPPDELDPADRRVFDALRQWRADAARAANVPAYVVFHDSTLRALALARPRSNAQLLAVAGIGPVKAGRFGADVLRVIAASSPSSP